MAMGNIAAASKKIWSDPVFSKVIAQGIIYFIAFLVGLGWVGALWNWWSSGFWWSIACTVLGGIGGLAGGFVLFRREQGHTPNIRVVDIDIPDQNPSLNLTYPLKCYVNMQNNSTECADVRIAEFRPLNVTLKRFVLDVLQVRLRNWCPERDGVDRVAVFPQQQFRAWIAVDERKFNEERVRALRGQIGTLVLSVDGKAVSIDL
jgi:hypothetical protein